MHIRAYLAALEFVNEERAARVAEIHAREQRAAVDDEGNRRQDHRRDERPSS